MSKTIDFLKLIELGKFKDAQEFLLQNIGNIDKNFKDEGGNTIIHCVIWFFIKNIEKICKERDEYVNYQYNSKLNKKKKEQSTDIRTDELTSELHALLDVLLKQGFSSSEKNNDGDFPVDFFETLRIEDNNGEMQWAFFCEPMIEDIEREVIARFEGEGKRLYAGRKYVSTFELTIADNNASQMVIPDAVSASDSSNQGSDLSFHQRFEMLEQYFQLNNLSAPNLVFANIGFIINVGNLGTKSFISIPISDPSKIMMVKKGVHNHSEAALYEYLKDKKNLTRIVNQLENQISVRIMGISAIVFDLYSTREICFDCESRLRRLQARNSPFLKTLTTILISKKYLTEAMASNWFPKVILRTAGFLDPGWYGTPNITYPKPIVSRKYSSNIETHATAVMFHLVPQNRKQRYSAFAGVDNDHVKMLYEAREVYFLKPESSVTLVLQTAFANSSKSEEMRGESPTQVALQGSTLLSYRLHLTRDFNELKSISEDLINASDFDVKISSLVLDYLYNTRNKSEVTEMVGAVKAKQEVSKEKVKTQKFSTL